MSRLSAAIHQAANAVHMNVSLESLADGMLEVDVSMEQQFEDLNNLSDLSVGLQDLVVGLESIDNPTMQQKRAVGKQARNLLRVAGIDDADDLVPSFESEDGGSSRWESFKTFLKKLWDLVVKLFKKIAQFIWDVLKKSTSAEKAAMVQLKSLRKDVIERTSTGLTKDASLQLQPRQCYLFNQKNELTSAAEALQRIALFRRNRDKMEKDFIEHVTKVVDGIYAAFSKAGKTPEEIEANVESCWNRASAAVAWMSAPGVRQLLDIPSGHGILPLAYDRQMVVSGPEFSKTHAETSEDMRAFLSTLEFKIVQVDVPEIDAANLNKIPAIARPEMMKLLDAAEELIDTGHSADSARLWRNLEQRLQFLSNIAQSGLAKLNAKKDAPSNPKVREAFELLIRFNQFALTWAAAPYRQLNTINLRVVSSTLALVKQHAENYVDEKEDGYEPKVGEGKGKKDDKRPPLRAAG